MQRQDAIIQYLKDTYHPEGMIAYGSFADGSANEHSDFDALVIGGSLKKHDSSVIGGTVLDVFVYPAETFQKPYDPEEFVQIFDGSILLIDGAHIAREMAGIQRQRDHQFAQGFCHKVHLLLHCGFGAVRVQ